MAYTDFGAEIAGGCFHRQVCEREMNRDLNRWTKNWWGRTNRKLEVVVEPLPHRREGQLPTWLGWMVTALVGIGAVVGGLYLFGYIKP